MSSSLAGKHLIAISDLTKDEIIHIITVARELKAQREPTLLNGYILGTCFFEPSTRTRLSFEAAMQRLGGGVIGFADASVTSTKKGETLEDTIRIVSQYTDIIAMRHPENGAAARAVVTAEVPIVNAGDGSNEHPTQALLDLFTIQECQGRIDGLRIALVGDLKYGRGTRSLMRILKHYDVHLDLVAPEEVQVETKLKQELTDAGLSVELHARVEDIIGRADILYLTRMQEERFTDRAQYERLKNSFYLTDEMMKKADEHVKILHVMPRVHEMDTALDASSAAYYFEQAQNGMYARQAVIATILGKR